MKKRTLLGLLIALLALRLALWAPATAERSRFMLDDSWNYHDSARALAELGTFALSPEQPQPQVFRTPGYPLFLAAVYRAFGERPELAILPQAVLSVLTVALVFVFGRERWDARTGLLAALLLGLDLVSLTQSLLLMTETLFALCIAASLVCAARAVAAPRPRRWFFLLGLTLSVATLIRPISYYLFGPVAVWVFFAARRGDRNLRPAATGLLLFAIPAVLLLGGWQLRNWKLTGEPVFTSIVGKDALFFRAAAVVALRDGVTLDEARASLGDGRYQELHPETRGWSEERLSQRWKREGMAIVLRHPFLYARVTLLGIAKMTLGTGEHRALSLLGLPIPETGPLGDLRRLSLGRWIERWIFGRPLHFAVFLWIFGHLLVLYLGSATWGLHAVSRRRFELVDAYPWIVLLYLLVVAAGPEAAVRYRVPWLPILCLYGAAGLASLRRKEPR